MAAGPVLTIDAPIAVALTAGGTAEARIRVATAAGYHVQANPTSDEFLIPVEVTIEPEGGVRAEAPVYPPGQPYRLQGAESDLLTYEGTFEIVVPLVAEESARAGDCVLRGELRYQACDARSCLAPTSAPVELAVRVVAREEARG